MAWGPRRGAQRGDRRAGDGVVGQTELRRGRRGRAWPAGVQGNEMTAGAVARSGGSRASGRSGRQGDDSTARLTMPADSGVPTWGFCPIPPHLVGDLGSSPAPRPELWPQRRIGYSGGNRTRERPRGSGTDAPSTRRDSRSQPELPRAGRAASGGVPAGSEGGSRLGARWGTRSSRDSVREAEGPQGRASWPRSLRRPHDHPRWCLGRACSGASGSAATLWSQHS